VANDISVIVAPKGKGKLGIMTSAGNTPTIEARGADANLNINLLTKGAGHVQVNGMEVAINVDRLSVGEATIDRRYVSSATVPITNGNMMLAYFTALKDEKDMTSVCVPSGAVAAVGSTLARIGVYVVEADGSLRMVAATVNDPTLWTATAKEYTRAFAATFTKVRGKRYAIGCLVVGSTTAPQLCGVSGLPPEENAKPPQIAGLVNGLTDLPLTVAAANVHGSGPRQYAALVP
jgi:hypothetical protein